MLLAFLTRGTIDGHSSMTLEAVGRMKKFLGTPPNLPNVSISPVGRDGGNSASTKTSSSVTAITTSSSGAL